MAQARFLDQVNLAHFTNRGGFEAANTGSDLIILHTGSIVGEHVYALDFSSESGSLELYEVSPGIVGVRIINDDHFEVVDRAEYRLVTAKNDITRGKAWDGFTYNGELAKITGSLIQTGSKASFISDVTINTEQSLARFTISGSTGKDNFIINVNDGNGSNEKFKVNDEGIIVLGKLTNAPSPIEGGLLYSGSELYLASNVIHR